jgi:hypothetical protein
VTEEGWELIQARIESLQSLRDKIVEMQSMTIDQQAEMWHGYLMRAMQQSYNRGFESGVANVIGGTYMQTFN